MFVQLVSEQDILFVIILKLGPSIYWFSGPKHRQRFLCEVRVDPCSYVAVGNSTNKKDAEKNASRDYVNYLVREGKLHPKDVPSDPTAPQADMSGGRGGNYAAGGGQQRRVFGGASGPQDLGEAYRPLNHQIGGRERFNLIDHVQEQKDMNEAESIDMNAAIHGNWTIENAKDRLNIYKQSNNIREDYKYTPVGPDHARYVCSRHARLLPGAYFSFSYFFEWKAAHWI